MLAAADKFYLFGIELLSLKFRFAAVKLHAKRNRCDSGIGIPLILNDKSTAP